MSYQKNRYMTVGEVALELRVAERTVYRWLVGGYLRSFAMGGLRRIDRKDMLEFIARAKRQAASNLARRAAADRAAKPRRHTRRRGPRKRHPAITD